MLRFSAIIYSLCFSFAWFCAEILLVVIGLISIWTPLIDARIAERWFSFPNMFWFAPVPLLVLACAALLLRAPTSKRQVQPFLLTLVPIFSGYSGLGISVWSDIVPPEILIWDASSPIQVRALP